jgi:hypothetical protein
MRVTAYHTVEQSWACASREIGLFNFRFGSIADMCAAKRDVRFTPHSDRESGFPQAYMSAFTPKADVCGANCHVCFGPEAGILAASFLRIALDARRWPSCRGRWISRTEEFHERVLAKFPSWGSVRACGNGMGPADGDIE